MIKDLDYINIYWRGKILLAQDNLGDAIDCFIEAKDRCTDFELAKISLLKIFKRQMLAFPSIRERLEFYKRISKDFLKENWHYPVTYEIEKIASDCMIYSQDFDRAIRKYDKLCEKYGTEKDTYSRLDDQIDYLARKKEIAMFLQKQFREFTGVQLSYTKIPESKIRELSQGLRGNDITKFMDTLNAIINNKFYNTKSSFLSVIKQDLDDIIYHLIEEDY